MQSFREEAVVHQTSKFMHVLLHLYAFAYPTIESARIKITISTLKQNLTHIRHHYCYYYYSQSAIGQFDEITINKKERGSMSTWNIRHISTIAVVPQRNPIWWNGCKQRDDRFPLVLIWVDHSLTRFSFAQSMSRLPDSVSTAPNEHVRKTKNCWRNRTMYETTKLFYRKWFGFLSIGRFLVIRWNIIDVLVRDYVRDSCSSVAHTNRFEQCRNWFTSIYLNDFPSHWPFLAGIMCLLR